MSFLLPRHPLFFLSRHFPLLSLSPSIKKKETKNPTHPVHRLRASRPRLDADRRVGAVKLSRKQPRQLEIVEGLPQERDVREALGGKGERVGVIL